MTRALALPENQVRAIMRAARKEGVRVEVKIGGATVTVIPDGLQQAESSIADDVDPTTFKTLDEYRAWRERKRARED